MADSWFQVHGADGTVLVGGLEGVERTEDNYFPPTIIGDVSPSNVLMQVPRPSCLLIRGLMLFTFDDDLRRCSLFAVHL